MNDNELLNALAFLIEKYLPAEKQSAFNQFLSLPDIPVKGILADFNAACRSQVSIADGKLIQKIYFYYC